jgi:Fe2+ transport system protein FeoA
MADRSLTSLERGATAVVTGFREDDENAVRKLLALGIVPGDHVRLRARYPVFVLELGSARYALDRELADRILVAADVTH